MIASKFGIGQQVRHRLSGVLGVIVDVDPEYALDEPQLDEIEATDTLRSAPWYHVVMEDEEGSQVHTYVAEIQLAGETSPEHPEQPSMDDGPHRYVSSSRHRICVTNSGRQSVCRRYCYCPIPSRGISIFGQRSITTVMPASCASTAACSLITPNCNQSVSAPTAMASCATPHAATSG